MERSSATYTSVNTILTTDIPKSICSSVEKNQELTYDNDDGDDGGGKDEDSDDGNGGEDGDDGD